MRRVVVFLNGRKERDLIPTTPLPSVSHRHYTANICILFFFLMIAHVDCCAQVIASLKYQEKHKTLAVYEILSLEEDRR